MTRETTERLVNLVLLDPPESQVLLAHQEREAPMVQLDPRAGKERREPRESLVWRAHRARQAPLVLREHLASKVLKVSEVSLAQLGNKVFRVLQALTDPLDLWVLQDYPV